MACLRLLALFAENKSGQLARVTALLAAANINIHWVTTAGTGTFGVLKLLVDDCDLAYDQLKHHAVPVSLVEALAIEVENRPGTLSAVALCLAENKINVENVAGFVGKRGAVLLLEVQDIAGAQHALEASGIRILTAAEVLQH